MLEIFNLQIKSAYSNPDLEFPLQSKHLINKQVKKGFFLFFLNTSKPLNTFSYLRGRHRHALSCKNKGTRFQRNLLATYPKILKHVEAHSRCHSRMPREALPSLFSFHPGRTPLQSARIKQQFHLSERGAEHRKKIKGIKSEHNVNAKRLAGQIKWVNW